MHKTFRARIKRLLDIDRDFESDEYRELSLDTSPAFLEPGTRRGRGADISYSLFDSFCLMLGLDMLDQGLNQRDVVFCLRHTRPLLMEVFAKIASNLPEIRSYREKVPLEQQVYMLLSKQEILEPYPIIEQKNYKGPVINVPVFCFGLKEFTSELEGHLFRYRKTMVFELSSMLALLKKYLNETPKISRGQS